METKRRLKVGDAVQITMISREWVARQRFIPKLEEIYTIQEIRENSIHLLHEKYGPYVYYKGQLKLKLINQEYEENPPATSDTSRRQTTLEIGNPEWWFVRYDFGIYSRYTKTFQDDKKPSTATAFLYLGILMEKNEEIKTLFEENWLRSFEVCESKEPENMDEDLWIIS